MSDVRPSAVLLKVQLTRYQIQGLMRAFRQYVPSQACSFKRSRDVLCKAAAALEVDETLYRSDIFCWHFVLIVCHRRRSWSTSVHSNLQ